MFHKKENAAATTLPNNRSIANNLSKEGKTIQNRSKKASHTGNMQGVIQRYTAITGPLFVYDSVPHFFSYNQTGGFLVEGANIPIRPIGPPAFGLAATAQGVYVLDGPHTGKFGYIDTRSMVNLSSNKNISTEDEATKLFTRLAQLTFVNDRGEITSIPYFFPIDGCAARAAKYNEALTELGYAAYKAFTYAVTNTGVSALSVPTNFALDNKTQVEWVYHVAPVVRLINNQQDTWLVFDPAIFGKPVTLDTWKDYMTVSVRNVGTVQTQSFIHWDELRGKMQQRETDGRTSKPKGVQWTTIAPGNTTFLPANSKSPEYKDDQQPQYAINNTTLTKYADLGNYGWIAGEIRTYINTFTRTKNRESVISFLTGLSQKVHPVLLNNLRMIYPSLIQQLTKVVTDTCTRDEQKVHWTKVINDFIP